MCARGSMLTGEDTAFVLNRRLQGGARGSILTGGDTAFVLNRRSHRGRHVRIISLSLCSLNARPTVGLQHHSRGVFFPLKSGAGASTTRPCRASFCNLSPVLEAKRQRLHCLATALCLPPGKQQSYGDQDTSSGNLFVEIIKSILRDLQNGVLFILKQPRELKYLEFPSLQSAGKMAIFTIAVVMVLIVFLATVDSGLSFIVASVFRRIS